MNIIIFSKFIKMIITFSTFNTISGGYIKNFEILEQKRGNTLPIFHPKSLKKSVFQIFFSCIQDLIEPHYLDLITSYSKKFWYKKEK